MNVTHVVDTSTGGRVRYATVADMWADIRAFVARWSA